ncbi:hypothetical protein HG421_02210 [Xanthomonas campestris pv. badrii]|uniref:Aerotolerance regulator N-terminal domain-containing protein n=1 Tax=Xanthomonas campestris pv. badrii TaxID=149696 RepID=A0A7Z2V7X0_XANCA|nr:hypothetical protein [Xanthomonas campestris]QJD66654.1 hypothetical protein HG421_02210 [Xanthomonas campestris pv. badrii]
MFANLSSGLVAAGAAILLVLVTALYLLKVRRRSIALAGATLWQQALRQVPPRLLGSRWHRPLGWLLSLLLVWLLWLAAAAPQLASGDDGRRHVFYLDASAWMLADAGFDAARQALERDVAALPGAHREVILGEALPALLLAPDERAALLPARLRQARAQPLPSGFQAWLSTVAGGGSHATVVHYYGAGPVYAAARAARPAGVWLQAAFVAAPLDTNRGIVALGAAPAASLRWDAVDVRVGLDAVGAPLPTPDALEITLDGKPLPAGVSVQAAADGLLLKDVPAHGGTMQVALRQGDRFPIDDSAALVLPLRAPLRVALVGELPQAVQDVLALDPSLQVVTLPQAQVQVLALAPGQTPQAGLPTLHLVSATAGTSAFRFTVRDAQAQDALAAHLDALGLDQARNAAIADQLGRAVGIDIVHGNRAQVRVWQELFAADGAFVQSRAMPLFVNRSLHWLAGDAWWAPYAAAGTPLQQDLLLQPLGQSAQVRARALGDRLILPAAGRHTIAGQPLQVSLLDRGITRGVADPAAAGVVVAPMPAAWIRGDLASVLLVVALLLCCTEWLLHLRGHIP